MKYLSQDEATKIDVELFNEYKFSVDQLMELAGLSCSSAISNCYPPDSLESKNVLVCCGPGNNGGDGLVAARHLALTGYCPFLYYPKQTPKELYQNLLHQCTRNNIPLIESSHKITETHKFGLIVDALFGFSFKPPVRDEFKDIINQMIETKIPIVSIDIPSGWDVETGCPESGGINPKMLISLTAPKKCAHKFNGHHYLGGLFVPKSLQDKYDLNLPQYPGTSTYIKL
ncbi:NAD(P)H-hydrate epimerase-like isoform X2 [Ctenocephalides felis]|nr:NAD(P)H-hydrate epimerase-like isoform X2 [Ctenocephalides felis]